MALSLSKLHWYWHRLSAMSPREVLLRVEKKAYQRSDRHYRSPQIPDLDADGGFPELPQKKNAPKGLLAALARDAEQILGGQWKAFGHLPLKISDPPQWHADNLVGKDLHSSRVAFKLDHRAQPGGADIKVLWEPNRWYQLVRLAMAAWLLENGKAQDKCIEWLHDWVTKNPPFTGLNWTSGLETGLRLIQYAWIDAFLEAAGIPHKTLHELRGRVLPPHVRYTWRYKSFGSSANNHLIGELAGLIIAQARWPELARISAPIEKLGGLIEQEILAQFAEDGGNNEQALGYHLFSWEFCFQAQRALAVAGAPLSSLARERLLAAGRFYQTIKSAGDPWDFGDSDNAWVTPLFAEESQASTEWWHWLGGESPALDFWWGKFNSPSPEQLDQRRAAPNPLSPPRGEGQGEGSSVTSGGPASPLSPNWQVFPSSGVAIFRSRDWFVRFDFSPLGYLSMAPHGHLDALHLSVNFRGEPIIIDPGTGAYYADKIARNYLAGWAAHNSPQPKELPFEHPKRFGTFLWGERHKLPRFTLKSGVSIHAEIDLPYGRAERTVTFLPDENAIRVEDKFSRPPPIRAIVTRWKFAPMLEVEPVAANQFRVGRLNLSAPSWKMARTYNPPEAVRGKTAATLQQLGNVPLDSIVSPAFRALASTSYLALESNEQGPFELLIAPA